MTITFKEFAQDSYAIINPSTPSQQLKGNDLTRAVKVLNLIKNKYAGDGLKYPIADTLSCPIIAGQGTVVCGSSSYTPTPDLTNGKLAYLEEAWITLDGVVYPLIEKTMNVFEQSYRYNPLTGLPRFVIINQKKQITDIILYPAASQAYTFNIRGKFKIPDFTTSSDMDSLPDEIYLFLQFHLAKMLAIYKGRASAWTQLLQDEYDELAKDVDSISAVNLTLGGDEESNLNGAWRVMSGI